MTALASPQTRAQVWMQRQERGGLDTCLDLFRVPDYFGPCLLFGCGRRGLLFCNRWGEGGVALGPCPPVCLTPGGRCLALLLNLTLASQKLSFTTFHPTPTPTPTAMVPEAFCLATVRFAGMLQRGKEAVPDGLELAG